MFKIENLTKAYWNKLIFEGLKLWGFDKNDKVWIVWKNGVGKSTFLKLLSWEEKADSWKIVFDLKNIIVAYASQEIEEYFNDPKLDSKWAEKYSVAEYLKWRSWYLALEERINFIYENYGEEFLEELESLQIKFESLWWYNFEDKLSFILWALTWKKINIEDSISNLSGGQKNKILLASVLMRNADILLLDEPTNNLDSKAIDWLIEYILGLNCLLFVVSHNSYFLDKITNKTLEIEKATTNIYSWNYSFYCLEKEKKENREEKDFLEYKEKQRDLKSSLGNLQSKRTSTQKVSIRKDNDKFIPNFKREIAQNKTGNKIKKIKKDLELLEKNWINLENTRKLSFDFKNTDKIYGSIEIEKLSFSYPNSETRIFVEKFVLFPQEKILISWDNASGKTSFLKLLVWDLKKDSWIIKISPSLKIWNYSQEKSFLNDYKSSSLDFLTLKVWDEKVSDINNILLKAGFNQEEKNFPVSLLSPWQKNKLLLAYLVLSDFNTIILDEPTNHLDLEASKELLTAIKSFNANLVVVSHDKSFVSEIEFDRVYEMKDWILLENYIF